jgi:hypothetical protein
MNKHLKQLTVNSLKQYKIPDNERKLLGEGMTTALEDYNLYSHASHYPRMKKLLAAGLNNPAMNEQALQMQGSLLSRDYQYNNEKNNETKFDFIDRQNSVGKPSSASFDRNRDHDKFYQSQYDTLPQPSRDYLN